MNSPSQQLQFQVEPGQEKKRLDVYLSEVQSEISRSRIKKLIDEGCVHLNDHPARPNAKLKEGDRIVLELPPPVPLDVLPEAIDLDILFEDDCMIAVDKPAGMVVHPAPGHSGGTLVNALLHHCDDLSGIGGVERPGIVHRLDKETSGVVLAAKTERAHQSLAKQFKQRTIKKVYLALVRGRVEEKEGLIDLPIGRHRVHRKKMSGGAGRSAQTRYQVIERFEGYTYLRLFPKTGRTHQIRVHLASIGHPILGDKLYGGKVDDQQLKMPRHALHAHILELVHPITLDPLILNSPLPEDMVTRVSPK